MNAGRLVLRAPGIDRTTLPIFPLMQPHTGRQASVLNNLPAIYRHNELNLVALLMEIDERLEVDC